MKIVPGYLYSKDNPQGKSFTTIEEYEEALDNGWKEAPWLVFDVEKRGPGRPPKKIEPDEEFTMQVQ